jgi:hypothetical protein
MRRLLFALCCITTSAAAQQTRAWIGLPGYREKFPIEDVTVTFTLDAPLNASYAAIRAAYTDLKIPITVNDTVNRIVGNQQSRAQLNVAGYRMSRVFDCGTHPTGGGQNADTYRVVFDFLALLDPVDATHTTVRVGFVAGAIPPSGGASDAVQCGSTGVMEKKLIDLATTHLK